MMIIANDDTRIFTNSEVVPPPPSILANDSFNGIPVTLFSPIILSFQNPFPEGISIDQNGFVSVSNQTANGTYTIPYTICDIDTEMFCDNAVVVITVSFCRTETPTIDQVIQPSCSLPTGSIALSNLPDVGTWMLSLTNQAQQTTILNGAGITYTIDNLSPGNYSFDVLEEDLLLGGCYASFPQSFTIDSLGFVETIAAPTYVDFNGDGFVNVGDVVTYLFTVLNNDCNTQEISISSDVITVSGGPITILPGETDSSITGSYTLTQNDINAAFVENELSVSGNDFVGLLNSTLPLNISDGIKLNAFLDYNANGIQDNSEPNFNLGEFQYEINDNGIVNNIATSNGMHFLYESNPLNTYALSFVVNSEYSSFYTVSTLSYLNVAVASGSGIAQYNFAITVISIIDLSVQLFNYSAPPRPGFNYFNNISYRNNSSIPIPSGTITFVKDPILTITSTSQSGTVANADGFTFDFVNLQPGEMRQIIVYMQVPTIPTVTLGQLVVNSTSITTIESEFDIANNASSLTQTIVGSYDPNDKTESHGSNILFSSFSADDYLTYTIRFENTGTANAVTVKVDDLLDTQLDENTVRTISTSHPYVLKRINNALTWQFDGIDLPPSVAGDEVTGHGYIVFQVKPKSGFALGDIIPNTAEIYFDFNPAIITNTWTSEFVPFLGVNVFENDSFEYYPNPTSDIVTFNLKNTSTTIETIEVMDLLGKTLLTKTNNYSNASIDLSSLSKGMYLVRVKADGQEKTVKIAKN